MKKKIYQMNDFEPLDDGGILEERFISGLHLKGRFTRITPWAVYTFTYDNIGVSEDDVHVDITEQGPTNKHRIVKLFIRKNRIEALATSYEVRPIEGWEQQRELTEGEKLFKEQYDLKWIAPEIDPPMQIHNTSAGRKQFKPISFDYIEVIVPVKVKIRTPTHHSYFSGRVTIYTEQEKLKTAKSWAQSVLSWSILPGALPCVGPNRCTKKKDELFMTNPTVRIDGTSFESFEILKDEK